MTKPLTVGGMWKAKSGLFVTKGSRGLAINVRHPDEPFHVKGVGPVELDSIPDAVQVLNKMIEGWPVGPFSALEVLEAV